MKRIAKRGLALLMAVLMCMSFLTVAGVHNHAHAADSGSYTYNWGKRGEVADEPSSKVEDFYTGEYTYDKLSQLAGGTGTTDAPNSALYSALKTLMTSAHTKKITNYDETRYLFQYTDCQNNGDPTTISCFYSGAAIGPAWDGGSTWNREHTWPNSKGLEGSDEDDIMMLRPTVSNINSSRGNKAYGESSGYYNPNSVSNGAYDLRGDVARIFLYVYVRWGNVNGNGEYDTWGSRGVMESLDVLLKWMEEDPVDTWELGRNDSVQSITGTRNVFVDYPELAFLMFGEDIPNDMTTPSGEAKTHVNCDHDYVAGTPVAPTCTAKGYTPYTCTKCQKVYNDNYTDMVDHNYVNGICTACGAAEGPYYVTEVETGKAYKLGLYSTNKSKGYYFTGEMVNTYYGKTSDVYDEGVNLYLEETAGGYHLFFTNSSGAKQYIYMVRSGNYTNFKYGTTPSTVFSWDADKDALYTTYGTETWYMGNYGSHYSINVLTNARDTDYIARLYTINSGSGSTECQHSWTPADCDAPKTCSVCGATEGDALGHNYEGGVCTVCGDPDPNAPSGGGTTTATITFDDTSKRTVITTSQQVWVENGITVTNDKAASDSDVNGKYFNPVRFYASSNVTIAYPGMTKIEITCTGLDAKYVDAWQHTAPGVTVSIDNKIVTITFDVPVDSYTITKLSKQARAYGMTVYAESGSSGGNEPECQHSWTPADCDTPKTCSLCGATEGEALGHSWTPATCTEPKTCSVCGDTEGSANGHDYEDGSCTVCGEEDPNWNPGGGVTEAWTLVTDVADLQIGDQIIIAAKSYNKALSTTQNKNNRGAASITKDGDTVTFGSDVQIIVLEVGNKANTFAFNVGNGYLYAAGGTGKNNYLKTKAALDDSGSWTITITSAGVATIKAPTSIQRNWLCYNSQSALFSCYGTTSNQLPVVIYKLVVSEPACQHAEWFEATCTDPKTCKSCGETEGEALGHSWGEANCTTPKTCSVCGATEGDALGHSWDAADCDTPKTCSVCGTTEGEALGHHFTSTVTVKPTCDKRGIRTHECTNGCGAVTGEYIAATGHNMVNGVCTTCGFTGEVSDSVTSCDGSDDCPLHVFTDLEADTWYHHGIHYCVDKGLIQGMPGNKFAPKESITRAQIVTILWRLAGSPVVNYAMDFEDVAADQWYTEAIRWAASEKLVEGYGNGKFGTNDEITREQFAVILHRYTVNNGQYASSDGDFTSISDADQISNYAVHAMKWAYSEGLIQGISSTEIDPNGSATRAQAATILYRYCENIAE